ncbi:MAG TPA: S8 family serine peptidase [Chitinophagaceae bacterium]|jgi:subtilisin family serine protease|nr:S8 family serine peptidase [Chitinophagaceae bacterium]
MHLRKTILPILAGIFLFACKKENNNSTAGKSDECVSQRSYKDGDIIQGEYIVAYKSSSSLDTRAMSTQGISKTSEDVLQRNKINSASIRKTFQGEPGGFVAHLSVKEAANLKNDPAIEAIEPDRFVALSTCFTVVEPRLITWNIKRVGYGDGTGKTAWVIDTGIDFNHPDLTVDQTRSKSFISGITSADDENGHGTHVAGIIGAKNNTFGVLGVASGATLVSLKVLDKDGNGTLSSIIQALGYVNANARAGDVVNMSLGEDSVSSILDQQVQNTAARGVYIAIAAGNDKEPARNFSPGRVNGINIFTVSAIDSLDNFASFSNFGNDVVDYAVPGVRILSTYIGGKYAYMTGTSMAAPHMAGLLLLKGRNIITSGTAKNDPDGTADPIAHY